MITLELNKPSNTLLPRYDPHISYVIDIFLKYIMVLAYQLNKIITSLSHECIYVTPRPFVSEYDPKPARLLMKC